MKALIDVLLGHANGNEEDAYQNHFVVDTGLQGWDAVDDAVFAAVSRFYAGAIDGGSTHLGHWMGDGINRGPNGCAMKVYDITAHLGGSPHGSPIDERPFTMSPSAASSGSLPEQIAILMTVRGLNWAYQPIELPDDPTDPDSGVERIRQRYTNRSYIGPWGVEANEFANLRSQPIAAVRETIRQHAQQLQTDLVAAGCAWHVWTQEAGLTIPVTHVQTRNRWVTQRRRAIEHTVTDTVAVPLPG